MNHLQMIQEPSNYQQQKKHEISYPHVNNNQKKHDIPFFSSTPEKKKKKTQKKL